MKHEAEQTEEEVAESRDSPEEDDRVRSRASLQSLSCRSTHVTTCTDSFSLTQAKRKYADYQQQQQQQAQYGAEEGQAAGNSFPPGSPAFSSPGNDPAGSSPPSSPPTASMPPNKKAMVRCTHALLQAQVVHLRYRVPSAGQERRGYGARPAQPRPEDQEEA